MNENYFYIFNVNEDSVGDFYPDNFGIEHITVISDDFTSDIEAINELKTTSKYFVNTDKLKYNFSSEHYPITCTIDEDPIFCNWIHLSEEEIFSAVMTIEAKTESSNFIDGKVLIVKNTADIDQLLEQKTQGITIH